MSIGINLLCGLGCRLRCSVGIKPTCATRRHRDSLATVSAGTHCITDVRRVGKAQRAHQQAPAWARFALPTLQLNGVRRHL
jgi:hypothetical protein